MTQLIGVEPLPQNGAQVSEEAQQRARQWVLDQHAAVGSKAAYVDDARNILRIAEKVAGTARAWRRTKGKWQEAATCEAIAQDLLRLAIRIENRMIALEPWTETRYDRDAIIESVSTIGKTLAKARRRR